MGEMLLYLHVISPHKEPSPEQVRVEVVIVIVAAAAAAAVFRMGRLLKNVIPGPVLRGVLP